MCLSPYTAKTNFSGATDNDYPVASNPNLDLASLPFVGPVKRVPLPQELVDQFNRILTLHALREQ